MALASGYALVSPGPARMEEFATVAGWAFIFELKERDKEFVLSTLPADRARAVEIADASRGRAGSLAAVYSSATYGMRVPGGSVLTTSGLTWVGVHPGHRRRGLLRAMIDDHFRASLEAGESVSTLYAMETAIYGRFGYGSCAPRYKFTAGELVEAAGADDLSIRLERLNQAAHEPVVRAVHARMTRAGVIVEPAPTMLVELLSESPSDRLNNGEGSSIAIVEDEQGPVGYARFHRRMDMEGSTPNPQARIHVPNICAATAAASRRLLDTLSNLDLICEVVVENVPLDDALITLSKDVRVLEAKLKDGLWLRILDLPKALPARAYAADLDLVLDVADEQLPDNAGRWRLTTAGGNASVSRTDDAPDVAVSIQDLSAAYLGWDHFRRQETAGLLTDITPGALRSLDAAFTTREAPFSNLWF